MKIILDDNGNIGISVDAIVKCYTPNEYSCSVIFCNGSTICEECIFDTGSYTKEQLIGMRRVKKL